MFELSPGSGGNWNETVLYKFGSVKGLKDGCSPNAGVTFDAAGNIYGTTIYGGAHNDGAVFELVRGKKGTYKEKVLCSFSGKNGLFPIGGVVFDAVGNLYSTTSQGGSTYNARKGDNGDGTVFELTP